MRMDAHLFVETLTNVNRAAFLDRGAASAIKSRVRKIRDEGRFFDESVSRGT